MSMRFTYRITYLAWSLSGVLAGMSSGCLIEENRGSAVCATATTTQIDTGASIDHAAGLDAGYYASYTGGGHWHLEWTCDTKLSAAGCNFTGMILVDTPPASAAVKCAQCESNDILTVTPDGGQTRIDFDTITSTGIDGVDFDGIPGHDIQVNLQINGLYQNDLVFVPSNGRTAVPACMPLALVPSGP